ncbi:hypothetical protein CEE37_06225 [candidate division LCP-89 bacterium B3_LCP]|uniref:histidine kinase n=1 Tax=candidate division LCP-89 bacterium B3_LCP TaxID=2012998 RepID=A0A532V214_UNCL8|nr:MAG: hypothetical protein CEE37_06225 [candidate division LCP-89 bacterium B3_LCP]
MSSHQQKQPGNQDLDTPENHDLIQRWQAIFNHLPLGVITTDSLGRILDANSWLLERFSLSTGDLEKLVGQPYSDTVFGQTINIDKALQKMRKGRPISFTNFVEEDRYGKERAVLNIKGIPLYGSLGDVNGGMIIIDDVTEETNQTETNNQALMLETTGSVAGMMLHDFNNLLCAILGHSQFIKSNFESESPLLADVDAIETAALTASEITRRLRSWVKPTGNTPQPLNLNDLIKETVNIMQRPLFNKINISLEFDSSLPPILADEVDVKRAIITLFSNAAKAMPQGGNINIRTGTIPAAETDALGLPDTADEGVWAAFQDTGVGMTQETREKLYEPFFNGGKLEDSLGLGLTSLQKILKKHHASIRVDSQLGRGSVFTLYFPKASEPVEKTDIEIDTPHLGKETVLLVDSEPVVRAMGCKILRSNGYTVLDAELGSQVLTIFRNRSSEIDLVILDMFLPDYKIDGIISELKRIAPDVQILITSGFVFDDETSMDFHHHNTTGFIQKPYRMNALLAQVRNVLDGEVCTAADN